MTFVSRALTRVITWSYFPALSLFSTFMSSYNKYLYNGIFIVLTILISLFRYLFNSSCASVLSEKRIKIVFLIEYDILIVFTNYNTFLIRLISMFNSSIRSISDILFDFPYLININLFTIFVFFIFILFIVLFSFRLFFTNFSPTGSSISSLFLRNLLTPSTRLLSYPLFFFRI